MKILAAILLLCSVVAIQLSDISADLDISYNQRDRKARLDQVIAARAHLDRFSAVLDHIEDLKNSPYNETGYEPHDDDPAKIYQTINNYLVDHVRDDDPESNMLRANSWLDAILLRNDVWFSPSFGSHHVDEKLVEAVRNFTALGTVGDSCNITLFEIVEAFDNITDGKSRKSLSSNKTPMRRIDKVANHYITRFAKNCQWSFLASLIKRYLQLDDDHLERVQIATNAIMRIRFDSNEDLLYDPLIEIFKVVSIMVEGNFIRDIIASLAEEDPDKVYLTGTVDERKGEIVVNEEKVRELYEKYLAAPCKYFVAELGDVLGRVRLLLHWYWDLGDKALELFLIKYRYDLCKNQVIAAQESLERILIDNIKDS